MGRGKRRGPAWTLCLALSLGACSGDSSAPERPRQAATSTTDAREDPLPTDAAALQPLVDQMVLRLEDMPAGWFATSFQTPGTAFLTAPAAREVCADFKRLLNTRVDSADSPVFARADTVLARLMASTVVVLPSLVEAERLLALPDDPDVAACVGESFDLGRALGQDGTGAGVLTRDPLFPLVGEESVFLTSRDTTDTADRLTETNLVLIRTGRAVAVIFVFGVNGTLPTEGIAEVGKSLATRMEPARPT